MTTAASLDSERVDGPNYERLVEVKRHHDPENVFHLNHNIDPAAALATDA